MTSAHLLVQGGVGTRSGENPCILPRGPGPGRAPQRERQGRGAPSWVWSALTVLTGLLLAVASQRTMPLKDTQDCP